MANISSPNMYPLSINGFVMACLTLQNFLMTENAKQPLCEQIYCPSNFIGHNDDDDNMGTIIPGTWRKCQILKV